MPATTSQMKRLLVLMDPSSQQGDSGAALASSLLGTDGHLCLAVEVMGPAAHALRAFADSEEISVRDAAMIYLGQAGMRLGHDRVSALLLDGDDLAAELPAVAAECEVDAVVIPAARAAAAIATKGAWASLPFPLLIAPGVPRAA